MTREQLEARLEEVESQIEAIEWEAMILYLEEEGFIANENGRLYLAGEAWTPTGLPKKQ